MKILYLITFLLSTLLHGECEAQDMKVIDDDLNYVVIGAFNLHKNAVRFAGLEKKQNAKTDYAFNANKKLYYVFIMQTSDRAAAIEEAKRLQAQSRYPDAWVYGKPTITSVTAQDINPGTNKETTVVASDKPALASASTTLAPENAAPVTTQTGATVPQSQSQPVSNKGQDAGPGKKFFFRVFSTVTGDTINGEIAMINIETNKKAGSFATNKTVEVKSFSKSGDLLFTCDILGYRGIKKSVNYNDPMAGAEMSLITEENGQYMLPFELVRLKAGDIAVMYDLFFYKDAAIIRAESRSEVGLLVDMMKENLKYKIRLHGHTNGNGSGKIIRMGSGKNFFTLTGSSNGYGSAMKLSEERAKVIKEYLVTQGIDETRIEVKAWGGKKPLYDVEHALAQSNVRVEVEILAD